MDLPELRPSPSRVDVAIAFAHASGTLVTEGHKALGACVFGAGWRMVRTGELLGNCAFAVLERSLDLSVVAETRSSIEALASFLHWHDDTLRGYWDALGEMLPDNDPQEIWPPQPKR